MMMNFCSMPFNSLEINPDGTCQVCCKIKRLISNENGDPYNVLETKIEEIWSSRDICELRQKFIHGEKPNECQFCWIEEDVGVISLRMQNQHNQNFSIEKPTVTYLSLKLSNKCNLACRICSPALSSLWQNQFQKLGFQLCSPSFYKIVDAKKILYERCGFLKKLLKNVKRLLIYIGGTPQVPEYFKTVGIEKFQDERLDSLKKLLENVKRLLIYGGEPFINEEVLNILKYLKLNNLASDVDLTLNTNATIYSDEIIHLLSSFSNVSLFLSIDDTKECFEYQRWPASWDKIDKNVHKFCQLGKPFNVRLFPTMSVLNVVTFERLLQYSSSLSLPITFNNLLHQPEILSIKNLPIDLKQKILKKIDGIAFENYLFENPSQGHREFIKRFMLLEPDSGYRYADAECYRKALLYFLEGPDKIRNQNMQDILTEFWAFLTQ